MKKSTWHLHKRSVSLAFVLFAAFVASTWAYSQYGNSFVLRVYELQQLDRADNSEGYMVAVRLLDYLRVDPTSDEVRGRLIDVLIDLRRFDQAVDEAQIGLGAVHPESNLSARLHLARALAAAGELESAESELNTILAASTSTEAHFALARIYAAQGDFDQMRASFAQLRDSEETGVTIEFETRRRAARQGTVQSLESQSAHSNDEAAIRRSEDLLVLGEADEAFRILAVTLTPESGNAEALFWRGVYEEASDNDAVAEGFYRAASTKRHSWASVALGRLRAGD